MSKARVDARPVEERHRLGEVPLSSPSRTSGVLEVFRRRYLLRLMVRREIQARYAGTGFGLAWSYINPFTRFLTFYAVFGLLLGRGHGLDNFAIHLFTGMVLVQYFTETVNAGTRSLLTNKTVIAKMALPRELFPVSSMLVSLWHAIPMLVILVIACLTQLWWGDGHVWIPDGPGVAAALLGLVIVMIWGTAFGLMFSCVNVIFRDFSRIVATFINMVPFAVPMMYPYYLVADGVRIPIEWLAVYNANPVTIAVMLFQRGFWFRTCNPVCVSTTDPATGVVTEHPPFADALFQRGFIMLAVGLVVLAVGQFVFGRLEKRIVERL